MCRIHRWLPGLVVFVMTCAVLIPQAYLLPQHGDERMYVWKAAYYGDRLIRLDFAGGDPQSHTDPGWSPFSFWAHEQPWGSHAIYALAMAVFQVPPPSLPYSWTDASLQSPASDIPAPTLSIVRGVAVVCAALGISFIAVRFGWPAAVAAALFLLIPHVRADLARAWAEGPLLLGIGLAVLAFGSPWFPLCVGLATGFKLTAIVLWPMVWFAAPMPFSRLRRIGNVAVTAVIFAVTTPYSWQAGGPLYLLWLLFQRLSMYVGQSTPTDGALEALLESERVLGLYMPTRYLWPVELAVLVGGAVLLARLPERRRSIGHVAKPRV